MSFSRRKHSASGKFSASITAKLGANGFGTLVQMIDADNCRGARWKLYEPKSAYH